MLPDPRTPQCRLCLLSSLLLLWLVIPRCGGSEQSSTPVNGLDAVGVFAPGETLPTNGLSGSTEEPPPSFPDGPVIEEPTEPPVLQEPEIPGEPESLPEPPQIPSPGGPQGPITPGGGGGLIQGAAVKGPILGGIITVHCYIAAVANRCPGSPGIPGTLGVLTSTITDPVTGAYFVVTDSRYTGPLLLSITGGTYVDPSGMTRALTGTLQAITAAGPTSGNISNVGLSALSTIAAQRAIAVAGSGNIPSTETIAAAIAQVRLRFGVNPNLVPLDITQVAPSLSTSQQRQLSVINEAIAQAALETAVDIDPVSYIAAIATDFSSDGILNGFAGGTTPITIAGATGPTATLSAAATTAIGSAIGRLPNNILSDACDAACVDTIVPSRVGNFIVTLASNGITVSDSTSSTHLTPDTIAAGTAGLRRTQLTFDSAVMFTLDYEAFSIGSGHRFILPDETFTLCVYDPSNLGPTKPGCNITADKREFIATLSGVLVSSADTQFNRAPMIDLTSATVSFHGTQIGGTVVSLATPMNALSAGFSAIGDLGIVTFTPTTFLGALRTAQADLGTVLNDLQLTPLNGTQDFKFTFSVSTNLKLSPAIVSQTVMGDVSQAGTGIAQTETCTSGATGTAVTNGCTDVTNIEGVITLR